MKGAPTCVLGLLLIVLASANAWVTTDHQGCRQNYPFTPVLGSPANLYNATQLGVDMCRLACDEYGYKYASLQALGGCFCGDVLPTSTSAKCQQTCPASVSDFCGGVEDGWGDVYLTPGTANRYAINNTVNNTHVLAFESAHFKLNASVSGTHDFRWNTSSLFRNDLDVNSTTGTVPQVSLVFKRPGIAELESTISATAGGSRVATWGCKAVLPVDVRVVCPSVYEHFAPMECNVTMYSGTAVGPVSLTFQDGPSFTLTLPDTPMVSLGSSVYHTDITTNSARGATSFFLLRDLRVREPGVWYGVRYSVASNGNFMFLLFRPRCVGGIYCHFTHTCISVSAACRKQNSISDVNAIRCTSGFIYSFSSRQCKGINSGQNEPTATFTTTDGMTYDFVTDVGTTTTVTGEQYLLTNKISVEPGDMFGVYIGSGSLAAQGRTSTSYGVLLGTHMASLQSRVPYAYTISSGMFTDSNLGPFAVFDISQGVTARVNHTYTEAGYKNISVTASNSLSSSNVTWPVKIEGQIHSIAINCTSVAWALTPVYCLADVVGGGDDVYTWTDGNQKTYVETVREVRLAWSAAGVYTVTLSGTNPYNTLAAATHVITVRARTEDAHIQGPKLAVATNTPFSIRYGVAFGPPNTYDINTGDGTPVYSQTSTQPTPNPPTYLGASVLANGYVQHDPSLTSFSTQSLAVDACYKDYNCTYVQQPSNSIAIPSGSSTDYEDVYYWADRGKVLFDGLKELYLPREGCMRELEATITESGGSPTAANDVSIHQNVTSWLRANTGDYIEFIFPGARDVITMITMGNPLVGHYYTTSLTVNVSDDTVTWTTLKTTGVNNQGTPATKMHLQTLGTTPIRVRGIRLIPGSAASKHNLRAAFIGCTSLIEVGAVSHTWTAPGTYNLSVSAVGTYSTAVASTSVLVQDPIQGLSLDSTEYRALGDVRLHFSFTSGTSIDHVIQVLDASNGEMDVYNVVYDYNAKEIYAQVNISTADTFTATASFFNYVSRPADLTLQFTPSWPVFLLHPSASSYAADCFKPLSIPLSVDSGPGNIVVFVEWGDGTDNNYVVASGPQSITVNKTYLQTGQFTVDIAACSGAGCMNATVTANPNCAVHNMSSVIPTPLKLPYRASVLANVSVTFTGLSQREPHGVTCDIDYDNGQSDTAVSVPLLPDFLFRQHWYIAYSSHVINITCTNAYGSQNLFQTVWVHEEVDDLEVNPSERFVQTGFPVTVNASMVWGSAVSCTAVFDSGPTISQSATPSWSHIYSTPGVYDVTVTSSNPVSSMTRGLINNELIHVQNPCIGFKIRGSPQTSQLALGGSVLHDIYIDINKNDIDPTNASVIVDFGDGTVITFPLGSCWRNSSVSLGVKNCVKVPQHPYTVDGTYIVSAVVQNNVSSFNLSWTHTVHSLIYGLETWPSYVDKTNTGLVMKAPLVNGVYILPSNENVTFNTKKTAGNDINYKWNFGSPSNYNTQNPTYDFVFNNVYSSRSITLDASNVVDSKRLTFTVRTMDRVSGLSISDGGPLPVNITRTLGLSTGQLGTDTCFFVDYADPTIDIGQHHMWGNQAECNRVFPNMMQYYSSAVNPALSMPVQVVLQTIGRAEVEYQAYNLVGNMTAKKSILSLRGPCYPPVVDLQTPNTCLAPDCDPSVPGRRTVMRSKLFQVSSHIFQNCSTTNQKVMSWTVEYEDPASPGTWTDMTSQLESSGVVVNSTRLSTVTIPSHSLNYGLLRFTLNVSMVGEIGLWTESSTYIRIIPTPLVATIPGGLYRRVAWNKNYTFDAYSASYDPDLVTNQQTGLSFTWLCKRTCETWPVYNADYTQELVQGTSSCATPQTARFDRGGCFVYQQFNKLMPGELCDSPKRPGQEFRYFHDSTGVLSTDTTHMFENQTVELLLVVRQTDGRVATYNQSLLVLEGEPPEISIQCVTNCQPKLSPLSRFAAKSIIDGWNPWISYIYQWDIIPKIPGVPFEMLASHSIARSTWSPMASPNISAPSICINPFFGLGNYGKEYYIRCMSYRELNPSNYGENLYLFKVNEPPDLSNFTCSISPATGYALNTTFMVTCTGAYDEDLPLSYNFGQSLAVADEPTWFDQGQVPQLTKATFLPQGDPDNNNTVYITVRVFDIYGSYADEVVSAKVDAMPISKAELGDLLNSDDSPLASLAGSGDATATLSFIGAMGSVLGAPDPVATSSMTTAASVTQVAGVTMSAQAIAAAQKAEEERLAKNTEMRDVAMTVAASLTKPQTLDDGKLFVSALQSITNVPSELSESSQDNAVDMAQDLANVLETSAADPSSQADQNEKFTASVLNLLGNVQMANALTANKMSGGSAGTTTTLSPSNANTVALIQRDEKTKVVLQKLSDACLARKVEGETESVIESPQLSLAVSKQYTKEFNNASLKAGKKDSSNFALPESKDLFGQGNSTAYAIQTRVTNQPFNKYTWSANAENVTANVMSLDIANETGHKIEVKDRDKDIEMWITNNAKVVTNRYEYVTRHPKQRMPMHKTTLNIYDSLYVTLDQTNNTGNFSNNTYQGDFVFLVFVRVDKPASETEFDHLCVLPPNNLNGCGNYQRNVATRDNVTSCFFEHLQFNLTEPKAVNVGVRYMACNATTNNTEQALLERLTEESLSDMSSDEVEVAPLVPYGIELFSASCLYWDTDANDWSGLGCKTGSQTTPKMAQCFCNHLTSFTSSFVVPMNTFDPNDSAFNKLDENPIIFAFAICLMAVYATLAVWARRTDLADLEKLGVTPLEDNRAGDKFAYEMTVWTGYRNGSSTSAHVMLILTGEDGETRPRLLADNKRPILQRGMVNQFLLTTPTHLGNLSFLRIWHDNTGKRPSWFFSRMMVRDIYSGKRYYFICDRWFAVEEDDGQVDRVVPVAGKQELTGFQHLFWTRTRRGLTDGHLWFSIASRPADSTFTRVQRLTCCLSLLFTTMTANILFYGQASNVASPSVIKIGPLAISPSAIYIGVISSLIAFPISFIIVLIFKLTKPRKKFQTLGAAAEEQEENDFVEDVAIQRKMQAQKLAKMSPLELEIFKLKQDLAGGGSMEDDPKDRQGTKRPMTARSVGLMMMDEDVGETPKKKKKSFKLPWWCIFIAYFLALASVGVSFWVIVEVGGVLGPDKSAEWLCSMVFSLVESICFTQPLKVLLFAAFYALVIKKPEKPEGEENELAECGNGLGLDEQLLHNTKKAEDGVAAPVVPQYQPPDDEMLKGCREVRLKEIKMVAIIKDIVLHLVFLYLLMMVVYMNQDPWSFYQTDSIKDVFSRGAYAGKLRPRSMKAISDHGHFWEWVDSIVVPGLYDKPWYNGQTLSQSKGFIADRQNYLVGQPRLRQLRITQDSCRLPKPVRGIIWTCNDKYNMREEDTGVYTSGWQPSNMSLAKDKAWYFQGAMDLNGYPFQGNEALYGGGGYVAELGLVETTARTVVEDLKKGLWLDRFTRGVFLEFVVYNPNKNLFSYSMNLVEFLASGGAVGYELVYTFKLDRYRGNDKYVYIAFEVMCAAFILWHMFKEIRRMIKEKKKYFKGFWSVIDVLYMGLAVTTIVMFFFRLVHANSLLSDVSENTQKKFINFQYAALWDELYRILLGFMIFVATVRGAKMLQFNKRIAIVVAAIRLAMKYIIGFFVIFCMAFFTFIQLGVLLFGTKLYTFSNIVRTTETLTVMILNKFDYIGFINASPVLGPLFLFSFTITISFILINMLISLILESFARVKAQTTASKNQYEIIDFMLEKVRGLMGIGKDKKEAAFMAAAKKRMEKNKERKAKLLNDMTASYVSGQDPYERKMEVCREKVSSFTALLNQYLDEIIESDPKTFGELDFNKRKIAQ